MSLPNARWRPKEDNKSASHAVFLISDQDLVKITNQNLTLILELRRKKVEDGTGINIKKLTNCDRVIIRKVPEMEGWRSMGISANKEPAGGQCSGVACFAGPQPTVLHLICASVQCLSYSSSAPAPCLWSGRSSEGCLKSLGRCTHLAHPEKALGLG